MAEEDILFGKHRHLFGGIAPSNMRRLEATYNDTYGLYMLHADLPEDTVIDGQTVCSVEGAVIRIKENGYPKDEFDGDPLATIYGDTSIPVHITPNSMLKFNTRYIRAFPFSTQGVYNRNEINSCVIDDIPTLRDADNWYVKTFYDGDSCKMKLTMTNIIDGNMYAYDKWSGYTIRYSTTGYPTNETDGELLGEDYFDNDKIRELNEVSPELSEGITYYCAIFPWYHHMGGIETYSYNLKNRFKFTARRHAYLFGYDIDTKDPNPSTRVTYPKDVDNAYFEAAHMDFEGGSFNYGGWENVYQASRSYDDDRGPDQTIGFFPVPVAHDFNYDMDHVLSDDDYTKTAVLYEDYSSVISDTSGAYNVMMRWPKIYTKRELTSDGIYKFRCSNYKIDDTWECWCNYNKNGEEIPYFYTAVYPACEITGPKYCSLSRQQMKTGSYAQYQMDYADNNGDGWSIECIADRLLIQDLLVLMAKTTNCQKAYGKGICGEKATVATTGTMDKRGLFWGSEDPSEGVKVFGMEHWWGNKRRRVAGLVSVDGKYKLKVTRSTKDGSTATDFNYDGSGYLDPNCSFNCVTSNSSEYISDMKVTDYGRLPINGGGTSSRHETDTVTTIPSGTRFANCGGAHTSQEGYVGPFTLELTDPNGTSTTNDICVAISYKG